MVNMRLSSKQAREFLEKERANFENPRWINHSICVCDTAFWILELKISIIKNNENLRYP